MGFIVRIQITEEGGRTVAGSTMIDGVAIDGMVGAVVATPADAILLASENLLRRLAEAAAEAAAIGDDD